MRLFLFLFILNSLLVLAACKSQNQVGNQGIVGHVKMIQGNQMPPAITDGQPVIRTVEVYELTNLDQVNGTPPLFDKINTTLIAKTETNKRGEFKISLPVGKYSVFIREKDQYFANRFDAQNIIQAIDVQQDTWSKMDITINYSASF